MAAFGKCKRFTYYYIIAYYVIIMLIIIMLLLSTKYITTLTKFFVVCSLIIINFFATFVNLVFSEDQPNMQPISQVEIFYLVNLRKENQNLRRALLLLL